MEPKNSHKGIVTSFLNHIIAGKITQAYQMHVHPSFRHHNPYFTGDAESLAAGMQEDEKIHPYKKFDIQHVIEEGDLIAVHSRLQFESESPEIMVVHLFRIEEEKIIELWDIAQVAPEHSVNSNGLF